MICMYLPRGKMPVNMALLRIEFFIHTNCNLKTVGSRTLVRLKLKRSHTREYHRRIYMSMMGAALNRNMIKHS